MAASAGPAANGAVGAAAHDKRRRLAGVLSTLAATAGLLLLLLAGGSAVGALRGALPRGLQAAATATAAPPYVAPAAAAPAAALSAAAAHAATLRLDEASDPGEAQLPCRGSPDPAGSDSSSDSSSSSSSSSSRDAPKSIPAEEAPPAPVNSSSLPPGCQLIKRACVDQQMVILQDPQYRPEAVEQLPIPVHDPRMHFNLPYVDGNPDPWAVTPLEMPAVYFRTTGAREPTPDMQHPVYNSHTLPVLFTPEWQENFGHTLGNTATWLHAYLAEGNASWASRVALVIQTPAGMSLPGHWHTVVAPLVPAHPLQTFADFSARLPPPHDEYPLDGGCSGSSSSGREKRRDPPQRNRCFAEMLVCAGFQQETAVNITQTAQHLVDLYSPLPAPDVQYAGCGCNDSSPAESASFLGRRGKGGKGGKGGNEPTCLKVLFLVRKPKPAIRQILNIEELIYKCNRWEHADNTTGARFAASCATYQPGEDLAANIAAVRSADVVIGIHGSSMANAFFMRPGAAMIEVFAAGWTWQVHRVWMEQETPQQQLQWWALTLEDPSLFSPGELEASLMPHPHLYKGWQGEDKRRRDQNLQVPWMGLERVLQGYTEVQAGGGMPAYLGRLKTKEKPVHWLAQAGGVLAPGGTSTPFGGLP